MGEGKGTEFINEKQERERERERERVTRKARVF
jgi:hypothetical protein